MLEFIGTFPSVHRSGGVDDHAAPSEQLLLFYRNRKAKDSTFYNLLLFLRNTKVFM